MQISGVHPERKAEAEADWIHLTTGPNETERRLSPDSLKPASVRCAPAHPARTLSEGRRDR